MTYDFYSDRTCIELHYNYKQACSDGRDVYCEDWNTARVGEKGVKEIWEHPTAGEGDRWFFDIVKDDNTVERVFNPCRAFYNLKT